MENRKTNETIHALEEEITRLRAALWSIAHPVGIETRDELVEAAWHHLSMSIIRDQPLHDRREIQGDDGMSTDIDYLRAQTQNAAVLNASDAAYLAGYEKACADLVPRWSDDMDAAPKDGTRLLLFVPGYGAMTGHFDERWHLHSCINREALPTHWMPLPPPPIKGET